jgi:hypothetical protein
MRHYAGNAGKREPALRRFSRAFAIARAAIRIGPKNAGISA